MNSLGSDAAERTATAMLAPENMSLEVENLQSKSPAQAFADFVVIHRIAGLRVALAQLLEPTEYRFIGIWRLEGGLAKSMVHYDRKEPDENGALVVPETVARFCFVHELGQPLQTPVAMVEERARVQSTEAGDASFLAVPLMGAAGHVLATLALYDLEAKDPEHVSLELLLNVASFLALGDHLPSDRG